MSNVPDAFLDIHILDLVLVLGAVYLAWDKIGKRTWLAMRGVVHEMDDRQRLKEIANAIGPVNGKNLMERLDHLEGSVLHRDVRLLDIEKRQSTMENKLDVFLIAQMRGGRRFYDPHDDETMEGGG